MVDPPPVRAQASVDAADADAGAAGAGEVAVQADLVVDADVARLRDLRDTDGFSTSVPSGAAAST